MHRYDYYLKKNTCTIGYICWNDFC